MTRYGTANFSSHDSAVRYYASQLGPLTTRREAAEAVDSKTELGEIAIGRPDCPDGCEVVLDPVEGRYFIQELPRAHAGGNKS